MYKKMVITNLRIAEDRYRLVRILAAEDGMSVNEYLNNIIDKEIINKPLGTSKSKKKVDPYQVLLDFAQKSYESKPMGLSKFDEDIYG